MNQCFSSWTIIKQCCSHLSGSEMSSSICPKGTYTCVWRMNTAALHERMDDECVFVCERVYERGGGSYIWKKKRWDE